MTPQEQAQERVIGIRDTISSGGICPLSQDQLVQLNLLTIDREVKSAEEMMFETSDSETAEYLLSQSEYYQSLLQEREELTKMLKE